VCKRAKTGGAAHKRGWSSERGVGLDVSYLWRCGKKSVRHYARIFGAVCAKQTK